MTFDGKYGRRMDCERCGKEYVTDGWLGADHARYCSNACRQAAYRRRNIDSVTDSDSVTHDSSVTPTDSNR